MQSYLLLPGRFLCDSQCWRPRMWCWPKRSRKLHRCTLSWGRREYTGDLRCRGVLATQARLPPHHAARPDLLGENQHTSTHVYLDSHKTQLLAEVHTGTGDFVSVELCHVYTPTTRNQCNTCRNL